MRLSLITASLILAIFTFVVVAGFSLFSAGPRKSSARLLAGFLLAVAASLGNFLYVTSGWAAQEPRYAFLGNTLGLAAAPLLYLYACSLAVDGFRLRLASALHFAPVLGVLGVVLASYTGQSTPVQRAILHDASYSSALNSPLLQAAIFFYVFVYLLLSVRVLLRHRALYKQQQATTGLAELTWLRVSLAGTLLLAVVEVLHQLLVGRWPLAWLDTGFVLVQATASFLFGFYFLVQALRQSAQAPAPVNLLNASEDKYGPHRLSHAELLDNATRIEAFLAHSGAHLQGTISIADLADRLPITARDISQTLNRHFGLSFFDFINQHRCEHARRLLAEQPAMTVTEVQTRSGFSSKSSFYTAFRKCAGMTPLAYRQSLAASTQRTGPVS
ncbi:AraC family transcriptional regulator [Dokdonella immobilis]|uniref:Transcriptional regulator, AraC family n=1 Tax=Dokdonella immobilis TaxID=578942 RepID=A0A1I4Y5T4_9GAMM|nr:helix-turn-helix domain-containing protein [Dokdonella immobilis]SFN33355.1 transcriptional regulator, AraC family [Dokdonella immobilis]